MARSASWRWVIAGAAVLAAAAAATAFAALRGGDGEPRKLADEFPYAQEAAATAGGITLRLTSADFSGTATLVRLEAEASGLAEGGRAPAALVIARGGVRGDFAALTASAGGALTGGKAAPLTLRLSPVTDARERVLEVAQVDLYAADGTAWSVTGPWRLTVRPPGDIDRLLPVEPLEAAAVRGPAGVQVQVVSAARSTTEVEVVVAFSGGAVPLDVPVLRRPDGTAFPGAALERLGDGPFRFIFPPVDGPVTLVFGHMALPAPAGAPAHETAVDLGAVIAANGLAGRPGESAVIGPAAVRAVRGAFVPLRLWFDLGPGGKTRAQLELSGAAEPAPGEPGPVGWVALPGGKLLPVNAWGVGYQRDGTGAVVGAVTTLAIDVDDVSELMGTVAVSLGAPAETAAGPWEVELGPAD
ncbi:hypothetical protein O0235_05460 [Tepidiforma flava]|uniref:Uncharacterized protein n=1 Tax=Tepidiforma flava TaxID=3004094 RepID=A0ABY7M907_9CHLR|nr:hypothetical protein [Tepidiforma flava]WBL37014.1 hypothetical protein O0235_05460 [Tepidiforma flava]